MSHQMSKKIKAKNKHGRDKQRGTSREAAKSYQLKRTELTQGNLNYRCGYDVPKKQYKSKPNAYQARKQKRKQKRRGDFDSLGSLFS